MTPTHRLRLLAFGLFTWCAGMVFADQPAAELVVVAAPAMTGLGAGCFVVGLLPGRTARFS
jgi:hypothetical protein